MKMAFYIEDGRNQVVLTPETKAERAVLETLHTGDQAVSVLRGSFYACQGGYVRHGDDNTSTMLVIDHSAADLRTENKELRAIIADAAKALDNNVNFYPSDPIDRLAILPHEVAALYGRVKNDG